MTYSGTTRTYVPLSFRQSHPRCCRRMRRSRSLAVSFTGLIPAAMSSAAVLGPFLSSSWIKSTSERAALVIPPQMPLRAVVHFFLLQIAADRQVFIHALNHPLPNRFPLEAPLTAHLCRRHFPLPRQLVDRHWMHLHIPRAFLHRHEVERVNMNGPLLFS